MRVLLTTHQFFPEFTAGTEVLTRAVARELISRGHQVHVFTGFPSQTELADTDRLDDYVVEGIPVSRFHHAYTPMAGQTSSIALGFDNQLAARLFGDLIARFKPDVVHFFHLNRMGTGLIAEAISAKVPAFLTPTDFWLICPTAKLTLPNGLPCSGPSEFAGNCIKHFAQSAQAVQRNHFAKGLVRLLPVPVVDGFVRASLSATVPAFPHQHEVHSLSGRLKLNVERLNTLHRIVAPNHYVADLLKQHGVKSSKIVESGYGIEVSPAVQPRIPRDPGPPIRLAFIGTLGDHKGCHILLEAFRSLPKNHFVLSVYGSETDFPIYAADLRKLAHGVDSIKFCGVFDNSQISEVLANVDVLVVPSVWFENTPLVVYSAQAANVVVVGSDFPGIAAAVTHNANGLLFKPGNVASLAACLMRLHKEADLLASLQSKCRPPKTTGRYVDDLLRIWEQA